MFCRHITLFLLNCITQTIQVTESCKYFPWGPHVGQHNCKVRIQINLDICLLSVLAVPIQRTCKPFQYFKQLVTSHQVINDTQWAQHSQTAYQTYHKGSVSHLQQLSGFQRSTTHFCMVHMHNISPTKLLS
jgi:hypothetical protein